MWTALILFSIILFTYIHLQHQLKTGEDMDVFEYEYVSASGLQEITQYKQPVLFSLQLPSLRDNPHLDPLQVKDIREYFKPNSTSVESISLSQKSARGLLDTDSKSLFYSDRNQMAIAKSETWTKWFETMDPFLQPSFTIYKEYDVLYGSQKSHTITIFHRESHVYIYLPQETNQSPIRVKMTPWSSRTFLDHESDYTYYEFWSKTNLFEKNERIRCLDFIVKPGYVLYIPPYWFYSIEYQNKTSEVCMTKYTTGANLLANAKHMGKYWIQQQNIQEKWWKPLGKSSEEEEADPVLTEDLSQNLTTATSTAAEKLVSEIKKV
jgi:hypothetical protein